MKQIIFIAIMILSIFQCAAQKLSYQHTHIEDSPKVIDVIVYGDIHYLLTSSEIRITRFHEPGDWELLNTVPRYPSWGFGWRYDHFLIDYGWPYLTIFDISDPINPIEKNKCSLMGIPYLDGDYLYETTASGSFSIYDLHALPVLSQVGNIASFMESDSLTQCVSNGIFYEVLHNKQLIIIDCRIPHYPHKIKEITLPEGIFWDGQILVVGNRLFVTEITQDSEGRQTYEWKCYQIDEDWNIEEIWSTDTEHEMAVVLTDGNWLIARETMPENVWLVDIRDNIPRTISHQNSYIPRGQHGGQIVLSFPYVYFLSDHDLVSIYFLSEQGELSKLADYLDGRFHRFSYDGFHVGEHYLAAENQPSDCRFFWNVSIYKVNPDRTTERKWDLPNTWLLNLHHNIIYAGKEDKEGNPLFEIYKIDDDQGPVLISTRPDIHPFNFLINDDFAFSSGFGEDLVIYDLSEPGDPLEIGRWHSGKDDFFCYSVLKSGDTLFVGDDQKVWILDIATPASPQVISNIDGLFTPESCVLYKSRYLIVADNLFVSIFDISNLAEPKWVQQCMIPWEYFLESTYPMANRVAVLDHYLVSNWTTAGAWIFDLNTIGTEYRPSPIGFIPPGQIFYDMAIHGNTLLLLDNFNLISSKFTVIQPGDLNEDGRIDSTDLLLMSDFISENSMVQPDPNLLDLNKDGDVNLLDLMSLAKIVSGD